MVTNTFYYSILLYLSIEWAWYILSKEVSKEKYGRLFSCVNTIHLRQGTKLKGVRVEVSYATSCIYAYRPIFNSEKLPGFERSEEACLG